MRLKNKWIRDDQSVCPKCGGDSVQARSYSDTVDFRNLELDVDGLLQQWCASCRYGWETPEQSDRNQSKIKDSYAAARDRLRTRDGLLTGDQIQTVRKRLSLTQKEAAALFGGGTNAFNKYESGEVLQSYAMDRLIRLVGFFGPSAVEQLRKSDETILPRTQAKIPSIATILSVERKTNSVVHLDARFAVLINHASSNWHVGVSKAESHSPYWIDATTYSHDIDNEIEHVQNHLKPHDATWNPATENYSEYLYSQSKDSLNLLENSDLRS